MKPLSIGIITSIEPSPEERFALVGQLGIPTVQIMYPEGLDTPEGIARILVAAKQNGIEITSVVSGFAGDAYDDIATVQATVGLVPKATRAERIAFVRKAAIFASAIGVKRLQTHIGYVPEDPADPEYSGVVDAMRTVCDDLAARGMVFALETGQETALELRRFIEDVARPNVRVNFDPANMILYGNDNPIPALDILLPFIDGIHCKDGVWPTVPGQLGTEMPLGQGDVNFVAWLTRLIELGYRGPLTIEREISGPKQISDIQAGKQLIESVLASIKEPLTVNVGIIGLGGMGRMHYNCYTSNPFAQVVAIADVDKRKRDGDWASIGLNVDTSSTPKVNLSGIAMYERYEDLLADPSIEIVDICLPTYLHADAAIAALKAGKHVVCEKPMVRTVEQIDQILEVYRQSGRKLMIGHCLRYWGEFETAAKVLESGEYGKPLAASLMRISGTPFWSWNDWLRRESDSGGAVLDFHIHDVDAAIWWFGKPDKIAAAGRMQDGLAMQVHADWTYASGLTVHLHSSWDNHESPFRYAFRIIMEKATLDYDSSTLNKVAIYQQGKPPVILESHHDLAYQNEIDDFVDAVRTGRAVTRVTPESSALSVAAALEELSQIEAQG